MATPIHTHRLKMTAGTYAPNEGTYSFVWAQSTSATTQIIGPAYRTIGWGPGDNFQGRKVWVLWRYRPHIGRIPGRVLNFHNHAQGPTWWPDGNTSHGVSTVAIDWKGDNTHDGGKSGLMLSLEAHDGEAKWVLASVAEMDACIANTNTWLDTIWEINVQETATGYVRIWVNGENTPRVNAQNVKTCWVNQTRWMLYEGMYDSGSTASDHSGDYVPARIGRTFSEAVKDGYPTSVGGTPITTDVDFYSSGYTHETLTPFDLDTFRVPASLGGTGGGGGGTPGVAPANTTAPVVSGTATVGQTLTTTAGAWSGSPTSYSYQWRRCNSSGASCANVPANGTNSSYTLVTGDIGSTIRVVVTATNATGSASATSSQTSVVAAAPTGAVPVATGVPIIQGTVEAGQLLQVLVGASWSNSPTSYAYQWIRCNSTGTACVDIAGETNAWYTVVATDVGSTFRVRETATNSAGSASATSDATGVSVQPPPENLPDTVHGWGDRFPSGTAPVSYGEDGKRASQYTSPDTRDITAIWAYQSGVGTSGVITRRFFISTSDGGSPASPTTTLVTCTPVALSAPSPPAWLRIPLPSAFRWDSATTYFVGFQTDTGTGDASVEGQHVTATGERYVYKADTYSDGLASPFGTPDEELEDRMMLFFEGDVVSPNDPTPPGTLYRLTSLTRSSNPRTIASGHTGGIIPGGGV